MASRQPAGPGRVWGVGWQCHGTADSEALRGTVKRLNEVVVAALSHLLQAVLCIHSHWASTHMLGIHGCKQL